jgi:hypothetical protein
MTVSLPLAFYSVVTGVAECVRTELVEVYGGSLPEGFRFCAVVPGEMAWDNCECGSFTQSGGNWLWSDNAETPLSQLADNQNNCGPYYLGLEVNALVLRCAPTAPEGQLAPDCDTLQAAAVDWNQDAVALRRAILCCLRDMLAANTIEGFQITGHTSQGPAGACVGSQLTYRFWLPNCECD